MSGPSKGWLGSKKIVLCAHCGKESRYDNLSRHTSTKHGKNVPVKFTVIEPKTNVLNFLKTQEKEITDNNNTVLVPAAAQCFEEESFDTGQSSSGVIASVPGQWGEAGSDTVPITGDAVLSDSDQSSEDEVEQYAGQTEGGGVLPGNIEGGDFIDADKNTEEAVHGVAGQGAGGVQDGVEGQLDRGDADQGSGVGLQSHVDDGRDNSVPGDSHARKRKLDDEKTSEPKIINFCLDDFDKKLDAFGEKLLDKVEEKINSISQSKKQVQKIPVVKNAKPGGAFSGHSDG